MITNTMKILKDLTNSFALFTIFILIWGYSSPKDSVKDNTLFLENK